MTDITNQPHPQPMDTAQFQPQPPAAGEVTGLLSLEFLEEHERFKDSGFRDLEAFRRRPPNTPLF